MSVNKPVRRIAVVGTGVIGSAIARQLASGGETLRLSSADNESARMLAAEIGRAAVVAVDNRDALQGADAVVLALRFSVLEGVIDQIAVVHRLTERRPRVAVPDLCRPFKAGSQQLFAVINAAVYQKFLSHGKIPSGSFVIASKSSRASCSVLG